jgi:hypothetical protein
MVNPKPYTPTWIEVFADAGSLTKIIPSMMLDTMGWREATFIS